MRRLPTFLAATAAVLLAGAGFAIEQLLPPAAGAADAPAAVSGPAASGAWYCAVGDTAEGRTLSVSAAVPELGPRTPAEVAIDSFDDGGGRDMVGQRIFPATAGTHMLEDLGDAPGVAARWWDAPAAVWRTWQVGAAETDDLPDGLVSGPCQAEPSDRWVVPGLATAGGAEAHLTLVNPFDSDASVAVSFTTPGGPVEPQRLENVVVPARSTRDVLVNDHAPEQTDLGAVVEVRSGRIVTEGYQVLNAAIGGIDAVSLVRAAPEPAEAWTVPWFKAADDTTGSWLWVTNVQDRAAAVALSVHTPSGGGVPEGLEEVSVGPGQVQRVDLSDALPEDAGAGGVTVRSENGVPVTVSAATQLSGDSAERGGLAIQLGARAPDSVWVLDGGDPGGRSGQVEVVNPTSGPAVVDLSIWNGSTVLRPEVLQDVEIPAGGRTSVAVDPGDTDVHTVFVVAEEGEVVAGMRSEADEGPRSLVAVAGVPGAQWRGGDRVATVQARPGLAQRVGTGLGVRGPDPLGPGTEAPQPVTPSPRAEPTVPSPPTP